MLIDVIAHECIDDNVQGMSITGTTTHANCSFTTDKGRTHLTALPGFGTPCTVIEVRGTCDGVDFDVCIATPGPQAHPLDFDITIITTENGVERQSRRVVRLSSR